MTNKIECMNLEEGREQFIQAWGTLGSTWGVTRTMAQIHALLLLASEPLNAEQIMSELKISRGNANMNIRALIDWGLVYKKLISGERKEFFVAEKDVWEMMRQITIQRKKRELEPMIKVINELVEIRDDSREGQEFEQMVSEIKQFSDKADAALDTLIAADANWFIGTFINFVVRTR